MSEIYQDEGFRQVAGTAASYMAVRALALRVSVMAIAGMAGAPRRLSPIDGLLMLEFEGSSVRGKHWGCSIR